MITFWGNYAQIEELFSEFLESVGECLSSSLEAISTYIEEGENEEVTSAFERAHDAESRADETRREIISNMLKGQLMPNTRGDFMDLMEHIDDVADEAEDVLDCIIIPSLRLSEVNKGRLDKMIELLNRQYSILKKGTMLLFKDMNQAFASVSQLEFLESEVDRLEEEMIRDIAGRNDLPLAEKMAYRDIMASISDLADLIENAGDKIEIIIAVRKG